MHSCFNDENVSYKIKKGFIDTHDFGYKTIFHLIVLHNIYLENCETFGKMFRYHDTRKCILIASITYGLHRNLFLQLKDLQRSQKCKKVHPTRIDFTCTPITTW